MDAKINILELEFLAWLHENAIGYQAECGHTADEICDAIAISNDALLKIASYLQGWGLVGCQVSFRGYDEHGTPSAWIVQAHLTSAGENYMRVLESEPSIAQKMTLATVKALGSGAARAADIILTAYVKAYMETHRI